MGFWENVKKDVPKGFREGIEVIRLKAEQLTAEGKRQLKLFDLKNKVHKDMADLGGAVYNVHAAGKDPMASEKVKKILASIKKLEIQISSIEKKAKKKKKAAPKAKAAKKKTAKKKATKKKTA